MLTFVRCSSSYTHTIYTSTFAKSYLAILVIFFSLVVHLSFQPYVDNNNNDDNKESSGRLLHHLELGGLIICFLSFWGGLIFFLKNDLVSSKLRIVVTMVIVGSNIAFIICSMAMFTRQFLLDMKHNKEKKRKTRKNRLAAVAPAAAIVPASAPPKAGEELSVKNWEGGGAP